MRVRGTGGLGFVGQAVTLHLLDHGHRVLVLTRGRTSRLMPPARRLPRPS